MRSELHPIAQRMHNAHENFVENLIGGSTAMATLAKVFVYENCPQEDWAEFLRRVHAGETVEIDVTMFDYWLGVLPPQFMGRTIGGQHYSFGFAEGPEPIIGFWCDGERRFCRQLDILGRE